RASRRLARHGLPTSSGSSSRIASTQRASRLLRFLSQFHAPTSQPKKTSLIDLAAIEPRLLFAANRPSTLTPSLPARPLWLTRLEPIPLSPLPEGILPAFKKTTDIKTHGG